MASISNDARDKFVAFQDGEKNVYSIREAVVLEKLCGTGPGVINLFVN